MVLFSGVDVSDLQRISFIFKALKNKKQHDGENQAQLHRTEHRSGTDPSDLLPPFILPPASFVLVFITTRFQRRWRSTPPCEWKSRFLCDFEEQVKLFWQVLSFCCFTSLLLDVVSPGRVTTSTSVVPGLFPAAAAAAASSRPGLRLLCKHFPRELFFSHRLHLYINSRPAWKHTHELRPRTRNTVIGKHT